MQLSVITFFPNFLGQLYKIQSRKWQSIQQRWLIQMDHALANIVDTWLLSIHQEEGDPVSLVLTFGDGELRYLFQNCCIWPSVERWHHEIVCTWCFIFQAPVSPSRWQRMARLYSRTTVKKIIKAHNPRSSLSKNVDVMVDTLAFCIHCDYFYW
jgi:hypothetical protein